MSLINGFIFTETFLAFAAKISGIIQETVTLMAIFSDEFAAFAADLCTANSAFIFQTICSNFQYQDSICPSFVLQIAANSAA